MLLPQAAYIVGVGTTVVTVSVVLTVLVTTDVATCGATTTVSGGSVTIVVVVLFTETTTWHSTPVVFLNLASKGTPSSPTPKPPLLPC